MPDSPYKQRILYDALGSFPLGMNEGVDPTTLPRNQAAFLRNATVRGMFARPRPAYRKIDLTFNDPAIEAAFQTGLWQAGGYYRPDVGNESVFSLHSGRLYQFVISGTAATVFDRTISGSTQNTGVPQGWMWQSEQFLIVNDGVGQPVIFDGVSSRRALDGSNISTLANPFTAGAIGATANATLAAVYSGPYNVIVELDDASNIGLFMLNSSNQGVAVTLENMTDTPGATRAAGSSIQDQTWNVGIAAGNGPQTLSLVNNYNLDLSTFYNPPNASFAPPGDTILVQTNFGLSPFRVLAISGNRLTISAAFNFTPGQTFTITAGHTVFNQTQNSGKQYTLGAALTVPAVGAQVTAYFVEAFSGIVGHTLFATSGSTVLGAYRIIAVQSVTASATVSLTNLTAVPSNYVFPATTTNVNFALELPPGRMGGYWLGRNWVALTDGVSFVASDIVNGKTGTSQYDRRDSVLRFYENDLLSGGGSFRVPGNTGDIRAIAPTAQLDSSLGQGPLDIVTTKTIFSCLAPVDRTVWQAVTNPILPPSVLGNGGQGQNSCTLVNSDLWFRSLDGIRSKIMARREFNGPGNVPQSREVSPTLANDDQLFLAYASSASFDNRLLMTCSPAQTSFGVAFSQLVALNFDALSNLNGKLPACYDGIWDGLNVLQLVTGSFAGVDRCFAFCVSEDGLSVELWEILLSDGPTSSTVDEDDAPIVYDIQSAAMDFGQEDPRTHECLRLLDGEIYIEAMTEDVTFTAYYRPEAWPDWVPWRTWTEKFDPSGDPGFRPRLGLGEPSDRVYDNVNVRPLREAYHFQFRLVISGSCKFMGARFKATTIPKPEFAPPNRDSV